MSEKEYIVSLNKGVDYEAFNAEMIASTGAGAIPSRSTTIANARPASQRSTHYMLTDEEAETLKADGRVYGVNLRPDLDPSLILIRDAVQKGDFTKTTLDRGDFLNWGMRRCNEEDNPYVGVNATAGGYNYTLDGSGVDIVIQDSGIQADHPEFQNSSGVTRVVEQDWFDGYSGGGSMPAAHYTDYDGHGTHVAGTATGKTYGWAKNAKIYSIKVNGLQGTTDPNSGIPISDCFDVIKEWHNNKPVDPDTGVKRPTIVNMSWGYSRAYNSVINLTYRGDLKTGTDIDSTTKRWNFGLPPISGLPSATYRTNVRIASVDADVQELIDAGVHVCIAAGNRSHKIDIATGDDYDNFIAADTGSVSYQRGSSPSSTGALMVGNIDSDIDAGGLEKKAVSSETGPGVDVYAPGTDIMSAMSTNNAFGATVANNPYPGNSSFLINNIGGTSMASPQVAGALALWLQLNPSATPAQAKSFITASAKTDKLYDTASSVDYTNTISLLGGNNRFLFNKFNKSTQLQIGAPQVQSAAATPTYALARNAASVNEGDNIVITLTTTNLSDATTVPYTISGVSTSDIGASLTGSFTITNNSATATFSLANDATTEGPETFTLTLDGISESISVTINDTSITPAGPTYSITPAANNVNEGSALTINVTTTNVTDATTLYYTLTNSSDFATSSSNFTITSNAGSFTVTPTADATTEGAETFQVQIRTDSTSGTVVATSNAITINDTSTTPGGAATYSLAASSASITEGENTTFTLTTTSVADATNVPYTITGVSSSDLDNGPRRKTAAKDFEGPGSAFFKREMQVGGVRLVIAGGVGGQTAVPDLFADKVARMFELFTDSAGAGINAGAQNQMIETLLGNTTSYHSNYPTIQRIARGAGGDYTPNFLTDAGIAAWGLSPLFDSTVNNDMVWYLNSSGTPGTGDEDAQEVIEHVFHTLHMHGLDAQTLKMYPSISSDWATGPLYNAMVEAYDASMWDPSGYNNPADAFKTNGDAFEVAAKEYLYLLNFCMFDYSTLWDGNSLAPEWNDAMRTPAGIQSNNPLGYALHNSYIAPVISKPTLTTIRTIFQDGDTGNPALGGASGYVADAAIPLTGNFTVSSNSATLTLNVAKDGVVDVDSLTVALDNGEATQAVTVADDGVVPGFAPDYALYVTNPGGNEYTLSGYDRNGLVSGAQPTLAYNNGDKVIVTVQGTTSSSHPFYIKTAQGAGTSNQASGVDGQGTVKLEWTIGSTGTFYYQCSIHSAMNNTITVS